MTEEQWVRLASLVEAVRPVSKVAPQDPKRTIAAPGIARADLRGIADLVGRDDKLWGGTGNDVV